MNETKVNEKIGTQYVLLVLEDGTKYGKILTHEALSIAGEKGLDLIQVANSDMPICKLADYGKMQYDKSKKAKHSKHNNQHHDLKGMRIKSNIAQHDLDIKIKRVREFLSKHLDVKISYIAELGPRILNNTDAIRLKEIFDGLENKLIKILECLSDISKWDNISLSKTPKKVTFSVIVKHISHK